MRLRTGYLDVAAQSIEEAKTVIAKSCADKTPVSVGLLGNAAEILPDLYARGIRPDLLTDQTSAHDPVNGYLPIGWSVADWVEKRESAPERVARAAKASLAVHVRSMQIGRASCRERVCQYG